MRDPADRAPRRTWDFLRRGARSGVGSEPAGRVISVAMLALFVVALALRLWGLSFGLPFDYQVSENMYTVAARQVVQGGLDTISPLFGFYQALIVGAFALFESIRSGLDRLALPEHLAATLDSSSTVFNLLGRLISALFGAATVLPVFLIGRRLWNPRVGLLAASFTAFSFMLVRNSHYAKPDMVACFLVILAAFFCLRLQSTRSYRDYLLAGLLCGLAISSKMLVWPVVVVLLVFHLRADLARQEPRTRTGLYRFLAALLSPRLAAASLASAVAFVATTPGLAQKPREFVRFYQWLAGVGAGGGMDRFDINDGVASWKVYLVGAHWAVGDLLLLLVAVGVLFFLFRREPRDLAPLLSYPLILFLFLLKPGNPAHERYLITALPFLLLPAAAILWRAVDSLRLTARGKRLTAVACAAVCLAQPAYWIYQHNSLLRRDDTRTQAKRWIEENVPAGAKIALEVWFYSPQLATPQRASVPFSRRSFAASYSGAYGLSERSRRTGSSLGTVSVQEYLASGYEFVVLDGVTASIPLLDPEQERAKQEFYASLREIGEPLMSFSPYRDGEQPPYYFPNIYTPARYLSSFSRPGPPIDIYRLPRLPDSAATPAE